MPVDPITFVTEDLEPVEAYKLLTALVVPRPIGWVGSRSDDGVANLAPFSFFNVVCPSPPTVIFAPTGQPGARKDTLANVERTGVFTLNLVTEDLLDAMNSTAVDAPDDVSEFDVAGLTAVAGDAVAAPYVAEAKATMECRMTQIVDVGRAPMASRVVFGEVVRFHISGALVDGTRIDQDAVHAVGRHAGGAYSIASPLVHRGRPTWPIETEPGAD